MITTVIFDLDGLLADTEKLHWRAYHEALKAHGAVLAESEYVEHWVRAGKGIGDWVAQCGLNLDPLALRAHKSKRYLELLATELRPMAGALELLEKLRGKKRWRWLPPPIATPSTACCEDSTSAAIFKPSSADWMWRA
jgi:beta-phosphoglucomutase-like phosphatase (HAD superfamily)